MKKPQTALRFNYRLDHRVSTNLLCQCQETPVISALSEHD